MIYTIVLIIILLLLILKFYNKKSHFINYYRCDRRGLGKITSKIFNKHKLTKNNKDWNLYIPCGYNNVEKELKNIKLNSKKNKIIFGINGCDKIVSKNGIWRILNNTYGRSFARTLMPESFLLYDPGELLLLRKSYINDYKKKPIFILKKNIQRKEGLKLTTKLPEIMNGYKQKYVVAQKYLRNLYLVNRRKVNLRVYLLIVIKGNKKKYYFSRKGKCIYTNKDYNDDNFDFESNITSYKLDLKIYKKNPRDFNQLANHLKKKNKDAVKLFNRIQKLIKYVCMAIDPHLKQSNNIFGTTTFQIFGGDIIFDNDMNPYLLEFNKGPDMRAKDKLDEFMKTDVQYDMFSLVNLVPKTLSQNSFFKIYESKTR